MHQPPASSAVVLRRGYYCQLTAVYPAYPVVRSWDSHPECLLAALDAPTSTPPLPGSVERCGLHQCR